MSAVVRLPVTVYDDNTDTDGDGDDMDANNNYDEGIDKKTAEYTIELTERALDLSPGASALDTKVPHLLEETGLQVLGQRSLEGDPTGVVSRDLARYDKDNFKGFKNRITSWYITLSHDDGQRVTVRAEGGSYAGANSDSEDKDYSVSISGDSAGNADAHIATSTFTIGSGKKKTVTITVSAEGAFQTYRLTLERQKPLIDSLDVTPRTRSTGEGGGYTDGTDRTVLGDSDTHDPSKPLKVSVPYETVAATLNVGDAEPRSDGSGTGKAFTITPKDLVPGAGEGKDGHQANLTPGDNVFTIKVDRYLQTAGQSDLKVGVTSAATYTLTITREAPVLDSVSLGGLTLSPVFVTSTMDYTAKAAFNVGRISVQHAAGPNPTGDADLMVSYDPRTDRDTGLTGHQVDLKPGKNVIKISVKSPVRPSSVRTYTFTVTRDATVLSGLSVLCGSSPVTCNGNDIPMDWDDEKMSFMASSTYAATQADVTATADKYVGIAFTSPVSKSRVGSVTATSSLRVGNNVFRVSASTDATGPSNTSNYTLTVDRAEPAPVIQFKLFRANGDEIDVPDGANVPLHLVSATRRYNLYKSDGFSVDVDSVQINAYLGDNVNSEDVKVSVGRVSIPVATSEGDFTNYHTMELAPGTNTMAFEVEFRQHPDDLSLAGRSVHTLTINREGNSRPVFRPNHNLGQSRIDIIDQVELTSTRIELPHAVNGNGTLTYRLEGKGGIALPEGLDMSDPDGRTADGYVMGAPNITPRSRYAEHTLILSVRDSDDITGASDEDSIEFTLRIYRDQSSYDDDQTPVTTGPAQLTGLWVYYDDPYSANNPCLPLRAGAPSARTSCAPLVPVFKPATMSYDVEVPTDVETVDIHAIAGTAPTVTLRGPGSPDLGAGSGIHNVTNGKRHEWNGYRVLNGGSTANTYILTVTEGSTTNEYRVDVIRKPDNPASFGSAMDVEYRFYEGLSRSGGAGTSESVDLPPVASTNHNGPATFSMTRSDTGNDVDADNFVGLSLSPSGTSLSGPTRLDSIQGRRESDKSGATGVYTVMDSDRNTSPTDEDSINVDVTVYRDVTLRSYRVDDTIRDSSALGASSRTISNDWSEGGVNDDYSDWVYTWDYDNSNAEGDNSKPMFVQAYTFPVAHTATEATLLAIANHSDATVAYSTPDANATLAGHQVSLGMGDNVVTVTVTNGDVQATHRINLARPGQQAADITVITDRGTPQGASSDVELSPKFNRDHYTYTATVDSWIETLRISARAVDPAATVSVNLDAINTAVGFAEVRLNDPVGSTDSTTEFRIGITNPTISDPTISDGLYLLTVTRRGNSRPEFNSTVEQPLRVKNNKAMSLRLPEASGGNGDRVYSLTSAEMPNGLTFSAATYTISGTPVLTMDQGYESDFILTYSVMDSDSNESAADGDSMTFTLTVTNGEVALPTPDDDGFDPGEDYNTLGSLVVSYQRSGEAEQVARLAPTFASDSGGPYTAIVPHDAVNVWVTPSLSDTEAALWIDDVAQQNARKVKILSTTIIIVEHTTYPALGEMTYTVNLSPTNQSVPSFANATISDIVALAGVPMDAVQLPAADGGNFDQTGSLSYTLKDHAGRDVPIRGLGGIRFNAGTRTLSGTPALNADADKSIYRLSYQAMDQDGDKSEVVTFSVTVCRSADLPGCAPTTPNPNPGYRPIDLSVDRSGSTATLTWTPGDDATKQFVAALIVNPTTGSIISTLRPTGGAFVAGTVDTYVFENLADASVGTYTFGVWGYDGMDSFRDAAGNMYRGIVPE